MARLIILPCLSILLAITALCSARPGLEGEDKRQPKSLPINEKIQASLADRHVRMLHGWHHQVYEGSTGEYYVQPITYEQPTYYYPTGHGADNAAAAAAAAGDAAAAAAAAGDSSAAAAAAAGSGAAAAAAAGRR